MATVDVATGIRSRIEVRDLDMMYGDRVIQRDLNFAVEPEDIFVIMGPSGSGKSTLLRHMIGLVPPARGDVFYDGASFWTADTNDRQRIFRRPRSAASPRSSWRSWDSRASRTCIRRRRAVACVSARALLARWRWTRT